MICPQCYAEYRPGYTTCSDCKVPLVEVAAADDHGWGEEIAAEIALADERRGIAKRFLRYGLLALLVVVGLVVLTVQANVEMASVGVVGALVAMYVCFGIGAYRYAESKGYHGMVGVACLIFGLVGLAILFNLRDKIRTPAWRRR